MNTELSRAEWRWVVFWYGLAFAFIIGLTVHSLLVRMEWI